GHGGALRALAVSDGGKRVACGAEGKPVSVWDVATGKESHRLGREEYVTQLSFSPSEGFLAGAYPGNVISLWDLHRKNELRRFESEDKDESLRCIAFAPDGRSLASVGADNTVRLWEVCTGSERCRFKGHRGEVTCLAWSP